MLRKTVRQTNDFGGIEKAEQTVKVGANEFISLGAVKAYEGMPLKNVKFVKFSIQDG